MDTNKQEKTPGLVFDVSQNAESPKGQSVHVYVKPAVKRHEALNIVQGSGTGGSKGGTTSYYYSGSHYYTVLYR